MTLPQGLIALLGMACLLAGGLLSLVSPVRQEAARLLLLAGAVLLLVPLYGYAARVRQLLSRRSTRYGLGTALILLVVFGIVVLVEAISAGHNLRLDLSEGRRHTLSEQTRRVLASLPDDVEVIAFYRTDEPEARDARELLRLYAALSPKFRYAVVDPDRSPALVNRYNITTYGTTVVATREKEERVLELDEGRLTSALLRVSRKGKPVVYFLTGHGEADLQDLSPRGFSTLREAIERAGWEPRELLLLRDPRIPEDAATLVLAGPQTDLAEEELASLGAFIGRGGRLLVLLDPFAAPRVSSFLEGYGIRAGSDVVIDRRSRVFGADPLMLVVSRYDAHPITHNFTLATLFPYSRSVSPAVKLPPGVALVKIAESGPFPDSWGETDRAGLARGQSSFDEGQDLKGPIGIAVAATIAAEGHALSVATGPSGSRLRGSARLVVFGTSALVRNNFVSFSGNKDLLLNALSWLGEEEDLIATRPREAQMAPLVLTATQGRIVLWLPVVAWPLAIAAAGATLLLHSRWSASRGAVSKHRQEDSGRT